MRKVNLIKLFGSNYQKLALLETDKERFRSADICPIRFGPLVKITLLKNGKAILKKCGRVIKTGIFPKVLMQGRATLPV
jgi:hypothetical protein